MKILVVEDHRRQRKAYKGIRGDDIYVINDLDEISKLNLNEYDIFVIDVNLAFWTKDKDGFDVGKLILEELKKNKDGKFRTFFFTTSYKEQEYLRKFESFKFENDVYFEGIGAELRQKPENKRGVDEAEEIINIAKSVHDNFKNEFEQLNKLRNQYESRGYIIFSEEQLKAILTLQEFYERWRSLRYKINRPFIVTIYAPSGMGKSFLVSKFLEVNNVKKYSKIDIGGYEGGGVCWKMFFGSRKGAFTGAVDKDGVINQKTDVIVIDNFQYANQDCQKALLEFFEDGEYFSMGDETNRKIYNGLIFLLFNVSLGELLMQGQLARDIYNRLTSIDNKVRTLEIKLISRNLKESTIERMVKKVLEKKFKEKSERVPEISEDVYEFYIKIFSDTSRKWSFREMFAALTYFVYSDYHDYYTAAKSVAQIELSGEIFSPSSNVINMPPRVYSESSVSEPSNSFLNLLKEGISHMEKMNMNIKNLKEFEKAFIKYLEKEKNIATYEIAKLMGISESTVYRRIKDEKIKKESN